MVEIDVLEPVYEQTEWVNSFVVVEKTVEIDSSNAHSPNHRIKKLTVESGILMKNSKVLIPESLKQKYINEVHSGHMGVEATLMKAREFIFWKGYSADIKEAVEKCGICQSQDRRSST